jgi:hypothetical protein
MVERPDLPAVPDIVVAAYNDGRRRYALVRGAIAAVFIAASSAFAGHGVWRASMLAVFVLVVATVLAWRSRGGLLGAFSGTALAATPLLMGSLVGDACACTGSVCFSLCGVACGSGSIVVGGIAGAAFSRLRYGQVDFVVGALLTSITAMTLCPASSVGSIVGVVVGAAVSVPSAFFVDRAMQKALA